MACTTVYGSKPDSGPGRLSAEAVKDTLNEDHPTWGVQLDYHQDTTTATYTSTTAGEDELKNAVEAAFGVSSYFYVEC